MSSLIRSFILLAALLGTGVLTGPTIRSKDIEVLPVLQERIPSITLGSYDLSTSNINDVLFDLTQKSTIDVNGGESSGLKLSCISCTTHGTALISTTGVSKDTSILNDIKSFFENPLDLIASAFGLNVKVSFNNVGGSFDFGIEAKENTTYSFPIFSSSTPFGAAVSEEVSFGMVLFVDLVVSLSEKIDLEAGFEFAFPDGAYITVDPLAGRIVDHGFNGGETDTLPVTVTSGSATLKAALRVRVQAGTTVILFGTGFDFELGIFADLIEYQATISSTPTCELSITEGLDVNIGAFAHAVGEINYSTFGASPAVVTTILEVPLPSLCLTRLAATSVLALPTDSAVPVLSTSTVLPLPSLIASLGTAPLATHIVSTPISSSTSGLFFQASSTTISPTPITALPSIPSGIFYTPPVANGTITSAAALTTSTVYATDVITLTSCSSNVLHCPASLTTEIVLTSTKILYTTICPVGAILSSTLPFDLPLPTLSPSTSIRVSTLSNNTLSTSHTTLVLTTFILHTASFSLPATSPGTTKTLSATALISPLKFTPCPNPVVETIYVPTFINPVYTIPTATIFPVPFPNWNASIGFTPLPLSVSTATVSPVAVASSIPVVVENVESESTGIYEAPKTTLGFVGLEKSGNLSVSVSTTGALPSATAGLVPFTGAARRLAGDGGVLLVVCLGLGLLVLL